MSQQNSPANALPQATPIKKDEKAPSLLIPIFKLPVLLYQLRLGWLLGKRFMQITHVGRRSGKVRKTILAVLKYDDKTREIYAVSAWKGSDWYYNIQASPARLVETGFVHYVPVQRVLSPEEITTSFIEFRQKHPIFSRMVCRIPGWKRDSTYAEFLELARTLRGGSFHTAIKYSHFHTAAHWWYLEVCVGAEPCPKRSLGSVKFLVLQSLK